MDITRLVQAVQGSRADDGFDAGLDITQWQQLAEHMGRRSLRAGELLIAQGDEDRCAYLLEQGNLQVFVSGGLPGSQRIAVLRPGALVGERALFAALPRFANVEAMTPCVVWSLDLPGLEQLCLRTPELALTLLRAAGRVMAVRARASCEAGMPQA
jgi:CRP/FNR family transcriptional regulator, cyclic AMP receptor protein